ATPSRPAPAAAGLSGGGSGAASAGGEPGGSATVPPGAPAAPRASAAPAAAQTGQSAGPVGGPSAPFRFPWWPCGQAKRPDIGGGALGGPIRNQQRLAQSPRGKQGGHFAPGYPDVRPRSRRMSTRPAARRSRPAAT